MKFSNREAYANAAFSEIPTRAALLLEHGISTRHRTLSGAFVGLVIWLRCAGLCRAGQGIHAGITEGALESVRGRGLREPLHQRFA